MSVGCIGGLSLNNVLMGNIGIQEGSSSSVRCRVVRCCGFHDSWPSLPSSVMITVELLMSLNHDVGGRPLFLFPLTFPVIMVLSSPFLRLLLHCPKNRNIHRCTISCNIPYMSRCPLVSVVCTFTSMTEEKCSYFKNMHKTHLLDENNILPSCEIQLP